MIKIAKEILTNIEDEQSALKQVVLLTKAIEELTEEKRSLYLDANNEYAKLDLKSPGQTIVIDKIALLSHNSNKATWQYPPSVIVIERQLTNAKKVAQKDGTAVKNTAAQIDPKSAFLFKIQLI